MVGGGGGLVTRYKALRCFFAARNVGWCGLPPAVGGATCFLIVADCSALVGGAPHLV
nr:MAG TPA: hypothetical protein [Caudoviricetes sp.]